MKRQYTIMSALIACVAMLLGATPAGNPPGDMVAIKGGCFLMGSDTGKKDQTPAHTVCLRDFFLDTYEVTQNDFEAAMGSNPSIFVNSTNPVDSVTWTDANAYCEKIGKRLPTEAEWEYAAREGGKDIVFPGFDNMDILNDYSWTSLNSDTDETQTPGQKKPNALGLYDMAGNVSEWVSDWHSDNYYKKSSKIDPIGPIKGKFKIIRGGSWCSDNIEDLSTRGRLKKNPSRIDNKIGLRCAMDSKSK